MSIYNHRTLQPTGPPNPPGLAPQFSQARLNESIDIIRQEFDALAADVGGFRNQKEEYEAKVASQVVELTHIRQSLLELENKHLQVKMQHEEEIKRLRAELHAARQGNLAAPPIPNSTVGPGTLGPAPIPGGIGGPSPYANDPYYARDRDRDRPAERERDVRDRERDRERVERESARERPMVDQRDAKRTKLEPPTGPGMTPKMQQPPPNVGPGLHPVSSQPPTFQSAQSHNVSTAPEPVSAVVVPVSHNNGFEDLDPANVPQELKKEGSDWFAVFNPKVKRALDVNLVHTLMHESVVCCVRFSADGNYLATGCNRTAQIYDTKTGIKTCVLVDESAGKAGDLYIRSVCFSPDGKYLATGAEDKQIRIWDIQKRRIRNVFDGHQQEIYSLDFSLDGRLIVSGSGDKTARIWDMVDGTSKVLTINDPDSVNNDAGVTSVAISPNGQLVAAGSLDTVVRIWDVNTGTLVERLRGHRDSVYSVAFTPDGRGLVSGSLDKTLKYWDVSGLLTSGRARKESNAGNSQATSNGGPLVRKEADKTSQCTMNFTGHKDYVLSVAVSHDGQWVVSGSKDRGVQFWDAHSAVVQCMLQGHKNSVISIDLSPSGNVLATGSGDWQARIWSYVPT